MRILLVEDDPMIGDAIQRALSDASYAADWVKNGLTGLAALDTHPYDLVLLDLGLPGKDGLDVLDTIRARNNPVPLLIITARDSLDDRLRGLDGGADDYLLKPFDIPDVARTHPRRFAPQRRQRAVGAGQWRGDAGPAVEAGHPRRATRRGAVQP